MATLTPIDATTSTKITPAAETFMRRMIRFGGLRGEAGFRLVVHPGGCSGYSSEFSIEPAAKDGDLTLSVNGMKLFVPAESGKLLAGVIIDHVDTPTQAGLTFFDPKAPATCATESSSRPEMVQLTKLNA
jgi:iron-sulfur cluster assembly accessory protein